MHMAYPFWSLVLVVWVKIAPAMLNNREHSKGYQMVPLSSRSAQWFGRDGASKEWAFVIYIDRSSTTIKVPEDVLANVPLLQGTMKVKRNPP